LRVKKSKFMKSEIKDSSKIGDKIGKIGDKKGKKIGIASTSSGIKALTNNYITNTIII